MKRREKSKGHMYLFNDKYMKIVKNI